MKKQAFIGAIPGAVTAGEGHRWGGAGVGALSGIAGAGLGVAAGGMPGAVIGALGGGAIGGHYYGKYARKKDQEKQAAVNELIDSGVNFDLAVDLVKEAGVDYTNIDNFANELKIRNKIKRAGNIGLGVAAAAAAGYGLKKEYDKLKKNLPKQAAVNELIDSGVNFDLAVALVNKL